MTLSLYGGRGFIRLVECLGDDYSVVQAARVSYGIGRKSKEEDERLIHYLMQHRHTSPFEMCILKFHLRVPIFVFRQIIRHRTASVNEYSQRYTRAIDDVLLPQQNEWRGQSKENKQASTGVLPEKIGSVLTEKFAAAYAAAREAYEFALSVGVAREQARIVLPLATFTEAYWAIDLHNLFHFIRLRTSPAAQAETRETAQAMFSIIKEKYPVCAQAFEAVEK